MVRRRKVMALLAYLAVTDQTHTRDALAALFWPDSDQSSARSNLRRDIFRLRQEIDENVLLLDRLQVTINPEVDLWLDVAAFRSRVEQALSHNHPPGALCNTCVSLLTQAAELYRGDFMAGFSLLDSADYDEWQFFERESLRRQLAEALQLLIQYHTGQAEFERAIEYGRRWLALDSLNEPAQRELMRLYAWSGQQAAAMRQYDEAARALDRELGVSPEPETEALFAAIKARRLPPPAQIEVAPDPAAGTAGLPAEPLAPPARYELGTPLAAGSHGQLYRGRDRVTGEPVVIKHLKRELIRQDEKYLARFQREGEALRQLDHPNIVHLLDMYEENGQQFLVMDYVSGGSLRELMDTEGALPLDRLLHIGLELADALSRAHHLGIIHRDLKPSNVLLDDKDSPRLSDFGIARLERDEVRLTQSGSLIGSPSYMSPEAVRGEQLDARSDIWSFGVMLYEMASGRLPFTEQRIPLLLLSILNDDPPSLLTLRPDLPPPFAALVAQMLVKQPTARLDSMRIVGAELEAIRAGRGGIGVAAADTGAAAAQSEAPASRGTRIEEPPPVEQRVDFVTSYDGVQVAYATAGEGPPLVKAGNWLSHLEHEWYSPVWRHWLEALTRHHMLVRYDERGSGLSDWDVTNVGIEPWVRDLEAVVDALHLERFPLLGISQGGAVAIAYAARHPERVSKLILYGSFARGLRRRGLPPDRLQGPEALLMMMNTGWGRTNPAFRQVFSALFIPHGTPAQMEAFNQLQQLTTSPENAVRFMNAFYEIDVAALAARVQAPTLVLHSRQDQTTSAREAQHTAALIAGARYVSLESSNHVLLHDEPAWPVFVDELYGFLGVSQDAAQSDGAGSIARDAPLALDAVPPAEEEPEPALLLPELPQPPTAFVGREQELATVSELLNRPETRLLTILAPGGMGKTQLALKAASDARARFADGVTFARLGPVSSPENMLPVVAQAVGLRLQASAPPRQQLLDYLASKQLLIILDSMEHLVEGTALVADILGAAPRVKLLVTSRERLNLSAEMVYTLRGMAVPAWTTPPDGEDPLAYGAVQLFTQRARMVRPGFTPTPAEIPDIVRICRLVAGMPLGVVLAASWLELLSVSQVADEVGETLDFLESEMRDIPERQRSMRAAFTYSWQRLPAEEQQGFRRLSVFRGGFTRAAAQQIAGANLRVLRMLINKSFVSISPKGRYEIHELLRQYGREHLRSAGEAEQIQDAHSGYYLAALATRAGDLKGRRQLEALAEIEADLENVRLAWRRAVEQQDADRLDAALDSLFLFCDIRNCFDEGARLLAQARPVFTAAGDLRQARLLVRLGLLHSRYGQPPSVVEPLLQQARELAAAAGDREEEALALMGLGFVAGDFHTNFPAARQYFADSTAIFRALGDHYYLSRALHRLGDISFILDGDIAAYRKTVGEGLDLARLQGNKVGAALCLGGLATCTAFAGDEDDAVVQYAQEAIPLAKEVGDRLSLGQVKTMLALARFFQGQPEVARTLANEGLREAAEISFPITFGYAHGLLALLDATEGHDAAATAHAEAALAASPMPFIHLLADLALALVASGRGEVEAVRAHIAAGLRFLSAGYLPRPLCCYLAPSAWLLSTTGQPARAAELLGQLGTEDRGGGVLHWVNRWSPLAGLRERLQMELGEAAFAAALDRGAALDSRALPGQLLVDMGLAADPSALAAGQEAS